MSMRKMGEDPEKNAEQTPDNTRWAKKLQASEAKIGQQNQGRPDEVLGTKTRWNFD